MPSKDRVTFADASAQYQPQPLHPGPSYQPSGSSSKRIVNDYFHNRLPIVRNRPLASPSPFRTAVQRPPIQESHSVDSSFDQAPKHEDGCLTINEKRLASKASFSKPTFRWIKGSLIGKGNQGKVYLAFNATSGEIMAIKQVERPQTKSDRMKDNLAKIVEALRDERETMKDLDHPNIVQYLGFEENEETLNIFLEYVSGGNIRTCLHNYGKFQEEVTKSFTFQILKGLSYLHSNGILHRDLKADNILVEESGVCKISDFGISKKLADHDRAFSFKGTSFWMAPEAITSNGQGYDIKIDIWSVGCIVFEMWTAERPWSNESFLSVMSKVIHEGLAPPLPEDCILSSLASHFRDQCFKLDPQDRPSASVLMEHPYLKLPPTWSFPGMSGMGFKSTPTVPKKQTQDSFDNGASEIMKVLSGAIDMATFSSPERLPSPALTMKSSITRSATVRPLPPIPPLVNPPRPVTPPLVYITPLGPRNSKSRKSSHPIPRKRGSSESDNPVSIQDEVASQNPRRLMLHKADNKLDIMAPNVPNTDKVPMPETPYLYIPPPLPEVRTVMPYSTYLLPQAKFIDPIARYPANHLQTIHVNPEYPSVSQVSQPPTNSSTPSHGEKVPIDVGLSNPQVSRYPSSYDSASDTDSSYRTGCSTWKKPPAEVATSSRYLSKLAREQSRSTKSTTSLSASVLSVSDSDSDSRSGCSTWQKNPADVAMSPRYRSTLVRQEFPSTSKMVSSTVSSTFTKLSSSEHRASIFVGPTRPGIREVFENLQEFFPEHNLDEPVLIESSAVEGDRHSSERVTMKSIKTIAEEQINRGHVNSPQLRRQTRLWDSRIEEIKVPR